MRITGTLIIIMMLGCTAFAKKPPDAAMLTHQSVETALAKYFSSEKNAQHLIHRSIFTPGSAHAVGKKKVRVIGRKDIETGKEVALVRIAKVTIQETDPDSIPTQLSVLVTLVTWSEVGGENLVPMHAFLTYEMHLNETADLKVVKESLVLE